MPDRRTPRREIVAAAFASLDLDTPALSDRIADYFTEFREQAVEPIPGAIETVRRLQDEGFKLALITNGARGPQRAKIERFGLLPLFDSILVEGEFGLGKPEAQVFVSTLDRLQVLPREAWMVGDNLEFDVAPAQKLGIWSIWVDWRCGGLPHASAVKPDRIISKVSELGDGKSLHLKEELPWAGPIVPQA